MGRPGDDVWIIGTHSTAFGKLPDAGFKELTRETVLGVGDDAGIDLLDVEFAYLGNCLAGAGFGMDSIRGQSWMLEMVDEGLFPERVPVINVEGACATASMALHSAYKDVRSGESDIVLAIGVEKTYLPGADDDPEVKARMFDLFAKGVDQETLPRLEQHYREVGDKAGVPFETGPGRTMFMDTYAMQAALHMSKHGTTQRQIAAASAKNHNYGALNPLAQYRFQTSVDQVLEDREVSFPLTRSMCAPTGDGAASAIVVSADVLAGLSESVQARAVRIAATSFSGGKYRSVDEPGLSRVAADKAYSSSGLTPADVDVAEVHDATSFCEIYQAEMLGFCPEGEGGPFVESGATGPEGLVPINTSGGLVSKGHPVGATGLSMIHELAAQLRGEAGDRQVPEARVALQENGGGVIGLEEAACSVVLLERAE
ncbi:MAG: thiolase family protein [Actinomycetota bacterium]|jgi:acetyl-CoA acetyltransferase|nr:thiolase family protein [Actinomycetota bacterium]